ncbi:MAG: hypothetical protein VX705_00795 [Verrucomicrobiota bacterium]|nr:hypothetical protein [Verrucomicrobiota bacterium]|tara:strand:- start:7 stop:186 length:180 start_codon:yes stop_codon:yes gene_type:complete
MKTIDLKSLIIGFLLCAVLFLATASKEEDTSTFRNGTINVRLVEIDRGIGADWDAIQTK